MGCTVDPLIENSHQLHDDVIINPTRDKQSKDTDIFVTI